LISVISIISLSTLALLLSRLRYFIGLFLLLGTIIVTIIRGNPTWRYVVPLRILTSIITRARVTVLLPRLEIARAVLKATVIPIRERLVYKSLLRGW